MKKKQQATRKARDARWVRECAGFYYRGGCVVYQSLSDEWHGIRCDLMDVMPPPIVTATMRQAIAAANRIFFRERKSKPSPSGKPALKKGRKAHG